MYLRPPTASSRARRAPGGLSSRPLPGCISPKYAALRDGNRDCLLPRVHIRFQSKHDGAQLPKGATRRRVLMDSAQFWPPLVNSGRAAPHRRRVVVTAMSAGHRCHRRCHRGAGAAWENGENQRASYQPHFKKTSVFLSYEIHFLCFLNTFKIPNKRRILRSY